MSNLQPHPASGLPAMVTGCMPRDGGNLLLSMEESEKLIEEDKRIKRYIRRYIGTDELIKGKQRYCLWISDSEASNAQSIPALAKRFAGVKEMREKSDLASTKEFADKPHRFVYLAGHSKINTIAVGGASSENRDYLPVDLFPNSAVINNLAYAMYDAPLYCMAIIASKLHLAWIATVCGKLETRYRYSNTLGWNTFPVPRLTEKNKDDLCKSAENLILSRESFFPATLEELYAEGNMPEELREVHEQNDELIERIYIGKRFANDTERIEHLFSLYTKNAG